MTITASTGLLDLFLGIPVHPLVVHAAVVLLPLAALAVIALVVVTRLRAPLAWPTLILLVVATASAVLARFSGEHLMDRVGDPGGHAAWGTWLPVAAGVLLLVGGGWLVMIARRTQSARGGAATTVLGALAALISVAVIGLTVLTGHSGSVAAWEDKIAESRPGQSESAAPALTGADSATDGSTAADASYTMARIAENATAQSCWAAIDGGVYDLTSWIADHPGGEQRILNLCGRDATADFTDKHATDARPNARLDSLRIGTLAG